MNGQAYEVYQQLLKSIYTASYQTLRAAFIKRAKALGQPITALVPDLKQETLRNYLVKKAADKYRADAVSAFRQIAYAPMRVQTIFANNTSEFVDGKLFVNVPEILNQVAQQVPQFSGPRLGPMFGEWIKENRLDAIQVPANKNLFIMRHNISADHYNNVLWSAWRQHDGSFLVPAGAKNKRELVWLDYVAGISQAMGVITDPYELSANIVDPKLEGISFVRVGYNIYVPVGGRNCFVGIADPLVQPQLKPKFNELTAHLVHKTDAPAFITSENIDKIGKAARLKIELYTPYGAIKKIPTMILGSGGNKKIVRVVVQNEHAHVFAPTLVNRVNYINDINDYVEAAGKPTLSTVIDIDEPFKLTNLNNSPWKYFDGHKSADKKSQYISGYITVDGWGTEAITTMNKFLRPSSITGIPEDDANPSLFSKTNPSGIFLFNFIRKNNLTVPPRFVHDLACKAGRPFGTTTFRKTTKRTKLIEIDQNASYASFERSPFYIGFPMGNWMKIAGPPAIQPDDELKPAFLEVSAIRIREDKRDSARANDYLEYLGKLRNDFSVITYAEYLRWSEFCEIDVINTTYATFKRISLYEDLNAIEQRMRAACPPIEKDGIEQDSIATYIKSMRNAFTGKLIQGGLDTYDTLKEISTTSKIEFDIMVGEHQRDFGELPYTQIDEVDHFGEIKKTYKLTTKITKPGHRYPHIYAYITALSRLSVLEKLMEINALNRQKDRPIYHGKNLDYKITRVHVDAIYVRVPSRINGMEYRKHIEEILPGVGTAPGQFKVEFVWKKYEQDNIEPSKFDLNEGEFTACMSTAEPAAEGYPGHRKIAVIGPGGCGKSTIAVNFLRDGNGRALYLMPTRELRKEMREKLQAINKDPSDCICLESLRRAIVCTNTARANNRPIPPEYLGRLEEVKAKYTHIIVDEFCKIDGEHLLEIINFASAYNKNVIMMGDYNQTIFSLSGVYATPENLQAWGFMLFQDPRNARAIDKPMRHSYEWGTFLDSIAELPSHEQVERLREYGIKTQPEDALLDNSGLIYCGTWMAISFYNSRQIATDTIQRVALIGKREVLPYVPAFKPLIWNKSTFTEKQPKGTKYTVDFATTVDCVQGSTVENPIQYIHVSSLVDRAGAIYTAVTRSRTPQQIILII